MKAKLLRRIIVSFVTSLLFAVIASLVFMNEAYGFGFYFVAFLIYGTPAIFIIGLPFSLVSEALLARIRFANKFFYWITLYLVYAAAGFIGTWLYFFLLAEGDLETLDYGEMLPFTLFGVGAALLFLFTVQMLDFLFKKKDGSR